MAKMGYFLMVTDELFLGYTGELSTEKASAQRYLQILFGDVILKTLRT